MSQFNDEIYDHITRSENFESAFEVYQIIPAVRKRLLVDFWDLVKSKIKEVEFSKNFEVEISDNIFERWSYLSLTYHTNLAVTYETLDGNCYYGLWIKKDVGAPHKEVIDKYRKEFNILPQQFATNESWIGWTYVGYDFNNIQSLNKIIPVQRESTAVEFAIRLTRLAEELFPHLLNIERIISPFS